LNPFGLQSLHDLHVVAQAGTMVEDAALVATVGPDLPKGSFHYFFEPKGALALAVIEEHWAAEQRAWTRILGSDAEPLERLRQLFEATQAGQESCGAISGCLFGNLSLDTSNQTEAIRERLQQIFEVQAQMVDSVIAEAGSAARCPSRTRTQPPSRSSPSWRARYCSPSHERQAAPPLRERTADPPPRGPCRPLYRRGRADYAARASLRLRSR
jgi:AcrR family transcriptional regulator